ncbi:SubName: Full=Uncharacterized protein {ECO:0000313/EMBL:CCA72486.1} [Serendipita indica DSM 11827]|uniref:TPR-like protein n=1 Tax=Serendipita indica (strain DSM 11827) TaxID=1109443 RepID=G4TME2_SERID|nr:SubName: Full=Uncharacterized protein {ECO:0000313/EMBL:CCA72486.1} [Serendipita indica DSM 11827]CCA72486.1 hypothetical protein PIIN_06421 [Serendipita indica DSM 11827]
MSDAEIYVGEQRVGTTSNSTLDGEERVRQGLAKAAEMKDEGNKFFLEKNWTSAITAYKQALSYLPSPPVRDRKQDEKTDEETGIDAEEGTKDPNPPSPGVSTPQQEAAESPLMKECSTMRIALNSNIAACEIKLEAWEAAVSAATAALDEEPHHQKALWRRAKANEALDSWSSLTAAQRDYQTLRDIVPSTQPLYRDATAALRILEPRIEIVRKRDTDKMLGQLKEVGDSVLGWFGLSTNNFQMTPNGQGGYSMNFVSNP